jgi:hypothetical protein
MSGESTQGRRIKRNSRDLTSFKRMYWRQGCQVCGWRSPAPGPMHVHHIIPFSGGGGEQEDNLIILCPNHHALAHTIGRRSRMSYSGPTDRAALIWALREMDINPDMRASERRAAAQVQRILNRTPSDTSTKSQDARMRRAHAKIIQKQLSERQLGWTVQELSTATHITPVQILDALEALYQDGTVAYIMDADTMTQTWFDIPRILEMAQAAELPTGPDALQGKTE